MRVRMLAATVAVVVLAGWPGGARPAAADAGGSTCRFSFYASLSPGLSPQPGSGTITTGGPSGTIDCSGPVNGSSPAGRGMLGIEARYGVGHPNGCASGITGDGDGSGTSTMSVPTSSGVQDISQGFTFTFGGKPPGNGGLVAGDFRGERFSGSFDITPTEGDCITAPVTKVHVTGTGFLH